ncbi:hypothetical protein BN873_p20027 [Candidatus Competibacter denitrificans Run_A_D11]|uniref:Uncharacterized protein n=1 Tax=Candidatus Competibacter denitrificans Run_A_D11 TaxID=1400863 RepID=W6MA94_9GAMM|nr:hypothetical protein [Candidatus Competibacter denitrificans]CDI04647.1 hypothetical protein BN873_p20027 [Candidatus Competibacter denitrificans Run_A_D11]
MAPCIHSCNNGKLYTVPVGLRLSLSHLPFQILDMTLICLILIRLTVEIYYWLSYMGMLCQPATDRMHRKCVDNRIHNLNSMVLVQ